MESDGRYQCVITPHARELSWLFEKLRIAFRDALDHETKYESYGRLADAANRFSTSVPPETKSVKNLLMAVLDEAKIMASEFRVDGSSGDSSSDYPSA